MSTRTVFIEPLDALALRGNRAFGDAGSHGESMMPPWPSVAAGAMRSWLLARDGFDVAGFVSGGLAHPLIGRPAAPGEFTCEAFTLARRQGGAIELLFAPPADLLIEKRDSGLSVRRLNPVGLDGRILSSGELPLTPVLAQNDRSKHEAGSFLAAAGWQAYLSARPVEAGQLVPVGHLWSVDLRTGVGLDLRSRAADDGKLFTSAMVVMKPGSGFVARFRGIDGNLSGVLRFGGDGRGAAFAVEEARWPEADFDGIARARRARLVLTAPGLFDAGWMPQGTRRADDGAWHFELEGVRARIVSAVLRRPETVSGFDLAQWRPKPARRAVPAGSVYWLDELEATPEALGKLAVRGLWTEAQYDGPRRAEGFNRIAFAAW